MAWYSPAGLGQNGMDVLGVDLGVVTQTVSRLATFFCFLYILWKAIRCRRTWRVEHFLDAGWHGLEKYGILLYLHGRNSVKYKVTVRLGVICVAR